MLSRRKAIKTAALATAATVLSSHLPKLRAAGSSGVWWEEETRMDHGFLSFREKPWFAKAQALKSGERIYLDLNNDGRRDTIIFKEGQAIVEVIDDGLHWSNETTMGDYVDSCWVIDYDGDGLVDRIIDYVDSNGDGSPDEVEFRFFNAGHLIWGWLFESFDGKWNSWAGWPFDWYQIVRNPGHIPGGNYAEVFALICQGNTSYAINKYDPERDTYFPISECPFAFFDLDKDGRPEAVIRVSAAPLDTYQGKRNPGEKAPSMDIYEYANSYNNIWGPIRPNMQQMGNLNVRYSYNIKNEDTPARPLEYDMGFTMVGKVPYQYPNMNNRNDKRRHPKIFTRIDHASGLEMANTYPADETGFSWDEWGESTLDNGARPIYEGVFWLYERHVLYNTGGPSRKWNMRREFDKNPSKERKLYYSEIDKRIHLFGAQDGWIEFGHILGSEKMGEIRYFDTNGDGYFDRWEFDMNNDGKPERIATVADSKARRIPFEYQKLSEFYTKEVLPKAISENQKIITGFKKYVSVDDERVTRIEEMAEQTNLAERKRYLSDFVREVYFQALIARLYNISASNSYAVASRNGGEGHTFTRNEGFSTDQWWALTVAISLLDEKYSTGDYDAVLEYLKQFGDLAK